MIEYVAPLPGKPVRYTNSDGQSHCALVHEALPDRRATLVVLSVVDVPVYDLEGQRTGATSQQLLSYVTVAPYDGSCAPGTWHWPGEER